MKRAIIMGATSGMGRGVALGLLKEGYAIGVAGRRAELLEEIRQEAPDRVVCKVIDVTSDDAPALLLQLINELGGMDLYFHSSGYGKQNENLDIEIEKRTVLTNSYGFTQMVDTAYCYFREESRKGRQSGRKQIAVISSIAGTKGLGASPAYSATKRFDWIYLEALAQQANMDGVPVTFTDIRPGFVATDFIKGSSYPMQLNGDYVVAQILKAVRKGKRKVTIDWKYRMLCAVWRMIPGCIWERMKVKG